MAAEVKISADNSQLISKLDQAIAKLTQFESKAKSAGGTLSKESIKGVKDAFDPVSPGALARMGAAGVAIYSAVRAVGALRNAVSTLKDADYISEEQRAQMVYADGWFMRAEQAVGRFKAGLITMGADIATGGHFSANAAKSSNEPSVDSKERQKQIAERIAEIESKAAAESLSDNANMLRLTRERELLEEQISAITPDAGPEWMEKRLALELKLANTKREQGSLGRSIEKKAEDDREKAAAEAKRAVEEMGSAQEKLAGAQQKHIELTETAEGKVNRLLQERDIIEVQSAATEAGSLARIKLNVQYQEKANAIIEAQNAFQREQNSLLDDANDKLDKAAKLKQSQQAAKNALEDDIGIASTDDPKLKARRQRMKSIKDDATRIMEQTGMGSEDAMKAAIQLNPHEGGDEEDGGRKRSSFDGVRAKIKGYSGKQRASNPFLNSMAVNKSFSDFFHNPQRESAKAKADANAKQKAEGSKSYFEVMRDQLAELQKLTSM